MEKKLLKKNDSEGLKKQYEFVWRKGVHLRTINDRNNGFLYSLFYLNPNLAEIIYNKVNGDVIAIKPCNDTDKLMSYLREDFF